MMRVAITGGTGFVGSHLGKRLSATHVPVVSRRLNTPVEDVEKLTTAFDGCDAVAHVLGRRVFVFPAPVAFHYVLAQLAEWTMKVPLLAKSQARMLAEGWR